MGNSQGEQQRTATVPMLLGYYSQCDKVATNTEDAIIYSHFNTIILMGLSIIINADDLLSSANVIFSLPLIS